MVVKKINAFHCPDIVWLDTHLVPRLLTGHRLVVHRCMCIVCTGMGLRFQNTLLLEKGWAYTLCQVVMWHYSWGDVNRHLLTSDWESITDQSKILPKLNSVNQWVSGTSFRSRNDSETAVSRNAHPSMDYSSGNRKPGAHCATSRWLSSSEHPFQMSPLVHSSFRKLSCSLCLSVCVGCSESLPGNSPALKLFSRGLQCLSMPREEQEWSISSVLGTSWSCWVVFFLRLTNFPGGQNASPLFVACCFTSLLIACVLASFPTKWKILVSEEIAT